MHGSGTTTLIISNEEMNDIMKIIQAFEDSNIFLKGVTKTIENETKEQKGRFLSMLLRTLGTSLLGNLFSGKGIVRAVSGHLSKKRKRNCKSWIWSSFEKRKRNRKSWLWSSFILCFAK